MAAPLGSGDSPNLATDQVDHETKVIFQNFVIKKFENDEPSQISNILSTTDPEITQNSRYAEVGRQLARIGDDVNERYKEQFEQIANELDMTNDTIYGKFSKIVNSMLSKEADWGRILTLFCFGYYLAHRFLGNSSFVQIFTRIQDCVIQFVRNYIAQWIISHGGWLQVAAQHLRTEGNHYFYPIALGGVAIAILAIFLLKKYD